MLRYKIAPKCLLPGPFGHSDVGGNPGVAGRFVAIISFLHTPVSRLVPSKSLPVSHSSDGLLDLHASSLLVV